MAKNDLIFKMHDPDNAEIAALIALRQQFIEQVELAGGMVTVHETLQANADLGINRWIVDDCDTQAATLGELHISLGNVADNAGNIFGNMVFEDEHGGLHKVITTYEILPIVDPNERADLLSHFRNAEVQTNADELEDKS